MPVYDANLLSIDGTLTNSTDGSALTIRGTGVHGMAMRFNIPSTTGTTNDILAKVETSDDDSTYRLTAQYPGGAQSWLTGGKTFIVPFATTKKYVRGVVTLSGSTGVPSFGSVTAGLVYKVHGKWSREKDFS